MKNQELPSVTDITNNLPEQRWKYHNPPFKEDFENTNPEVILQDTKPFISTKSGSPYFNLTFYHSKGKDNVRRKKECKTYRPIIQVWWR